MTESADAVAVGHLVPSRRGDGRLVAEEVDAPRERQRKLVAVQLLVGARADDNVAVRGDVLEDSLVPLGQLEPAVREHDHRVRCA